MNLLYLISVRKLLLLSILFNSYCGLSQDSLTADYINSIVSRIEERLPFLTMERKDTLIYEENDSLNKNIPLSVRTEYYFNLNNNHVEKIIERTRYKTLVTELTMYYLMGQPIRFSTTQREGNVIKMDFDVFYMNDHYVHFINRNGRKGKPDGDQFLKWCYQLLHSYDKNSFENK